MSVLISSKSLLPVRRDKQTAFNINVSGGGGFAGGGTSGQPPAYVNIINGTPSTGQVAVFHDASSIEGNAALVFDIATGWLYISHLRSAGTDNLYYYTDYQMQFTAGDWITMFSPNGLNAQVPVLSLGFLQDVSIYPNTAYNIKGYKLTVQGGPATSSPGGSDYDGGDLHLDGGTPAGSGIPGKVFIGTGSGGTNALAGSGTGTSILYYNRTTGEITYGDK